ncbi:hypothetical protein EVA_02208 [gut metagenome]|uniref:Uncharacterized protein n=1 Tax=gut metagenome TaxID=749906 RepID=J9GNJ9_9ZZZZ
MNLPRSCSPPFLLYVDREYLDATYIFPTQPCAHPTGRMSKVLCRIGRQSKVHEPYSLYKKSSS